MEFSWSPNSSGNLRDPWTGIHLSQIPYTYRAGAGMGAPAVGLWDVACGMVRLCLIYTVASTSSVPRGVLPLISYVF